MSGFCEQHGPHDGVTCRYCGVANAPRAAGNHHQQDKEVRFDEAETQLGGNGFSSVEDSSEQVTQDGGGSNGSNGNPIDPPTQIPRRMAATGARRDPQGYDDFDHTVLDQLSAGPLGILIIKSPMEYRGNVIKVQSGDVIGRSEGNILIQDRRISKSHARVNLIEVEQDDDDPKEVFAIFDFGTSNGTKINGERIEGRALLEENDEIQLGEHVFVFKQL